VAAVETLDRAALDALDEVLGAAAVDDIIAVFLADVPARLARMQALAAAGGSGRLAREAHALAGSAGTLGLRALAAAARVLETELAGSGADLPARLAPVEALAGPATARLAARVAA
jgi:HPt (histidine-containing phosphotransfer) domain-containing protein